MTWPTQTPEAIAERMAARLEDAFPGLDARSGRTFASILTIAQSMEIFDLHLFLQLLVREAFPDTARLTLEWHAATWDVDRIDATIAVGPVTFPQGQAGTPIPAGTGLLLGNVGFTVVETVTVGAGGTALAQVRAAEAGPAGNVPAGATLTLVSPVPGLTIQAATVGAGGISGGEPQEELEALRARVLAEIRRRGEGGKTDDYVGWAKAASSAVAKVRPVGRWAGKGTVGVIVAMAGPRAPTGAELALIGAAVEAERPVTADVIPVAADVVPVAFIIHVTPDTAAIRAAVTASLAAFMQAEAEIAGTLDESRIREAISAAAGEYSHKVLQPAGDLVAGPAQLHALGSVAFA